MGMVDNIVAEGVITLGRDGRVASFNQAAAAMLGGRAGQLIGCPAAVLLPPPGVTERYEELTRQLDAGSAALAWQHAAREDERSRIARDLHDELGGLLTGLRAYLAVGLDGCAAGRPMPAQHLADSCALADAAIEAVRRVVGELRPGALDQLGLWEALAWQARQCAERAGLACAVEFEPACAAVRLSGPGGTAVFRIVQEALTNVVRHAGASRVSLEARRDGAALTLRVVDDGNGLACAGAPGHWGMRGMDERARSLGAELSVTGAPGRGTTVLLRLPLARQELQPNPQPKPQPKPQPNPQPNPRQGSLSDG